jgi:hypothetical protein
VPLQKNMHGDYERIAEFLRGLSFRLRLLAILESILQLTAGCIVVILGSYFAIEIQEKTPYLAFFYCLAALIFVGFLFFLGVKRVIPGPGLKLVARGLEAKFPGLRDDITNALSLFQDMRLLKHGQISAGLVAAQMRKTAEEVCALEPSQVINIRRPLRHLRVLGPLMAALIAVLGLDPHFLNRSLALITNPFSALPQIKTTLTIEPGDRTILRGNPVSIRVKAAGNIPEKLILEIRPEGRDAARTEMKAEGDGNFSYRIPAALSSLRYQAYNGRASSPEHRILVVDPPEVGGMKLTLIPPDYTGLPKEEKEDGHIEALKGTLVNIEALATKRVREGKIVVDSKNQMPLEVSGNRLKGSLLIFDPGAYTIEVEDELGFANPAPARYRIRLIPDQYPEVELMSPSEDLEVAGNETVPVVFTAKDDFGISTMRLNFQIGGREMTFSLKSPGGQRALGPETFKWDLAALALTPGERISYWIEAGDNDAVSGPKFSSSRILNLFVRDERIRAAREGEEAQQIADALMDLLADQLEDLKENEFPSRRMEEILERVDRNLAQRQDRADRFDLEQLRRNLASLKSRVAEEPKENVTREMERLALLAEDIAKKARMNEMEAMARELRNRQRRLLDSLNELKNRQDPKALEAILKELKQLEDLLRGVMEALGKLANRLPDDFVNSPDLQGMDLQDLFKDLDEIRQKLMAGDLAGALEAAQRLMQALTEMMASLGRAGAQANMGGMDRLQGEMNRQSGELSKILEEQREILQETEKIEREMRRRMEEEIRKKLDQELPRLRERLQALGRSFLPEQKEMIEELERLLKEEKMKMFSERAGEMEKEFTQRPGDRERLRELKEMAAGLVPERSKILSETEMGRFPDLSSRQGLLQERTKGLKEKLEMLSQLFPGMDTEILKDLQGAAGAMGEASSQLTREDAPGAIPPEQEAIRGLAKSQQAMQQMAQQMAMQMQAMRYGNPWGYDPRPGWYYGPWVPMPTLPQPQVNRPRERGYTGIDREEFEPPSKEAYQVPKIFREKVMESLKDEVPSPYRRKVEKYFRGLTE